MMNKFYAELSGLDHKAIREEYKESLSSKKFATQGEVRKELASIYINSSYGEIALRAREEIKGDNTEKNAFDTPEYLSLATLIFKYTTQIKGDFLAAPSGIEGKNHADIISGIGSNITLYNIAALSMDQLDRINNFDDSKESLHLFKNHLSSEGKILLGGRADKTLGATSGGLANTINFGSNELEDFVKLISDAKIIDMVSSSEVDSAKTAVNLAKFLSESELSIDAKWTALEPYVKLILENVDGDGDNSQNAAKAIKEQDHSLFVDNILRENGEYKILNPDDPENAFHIRNNAAKREAHEELSELKGAAEKYQKIRNISEMLDEEPVIGAVDGTARDPLFTNQYGAFFDEPKDDGRTLHTSPTCFAMRPKEGEEGEFISLLHEMEKAEKTPTTKNSVKIEKEVENLQIKDIWEAMKYSGSVVNSDAGDVVPLGGGKTVSPFSKFAQTHEGDFVRGEYHHEMLVPVAIATRFILSNSFAASIKKHLIELENTDIYGKLIKICQRDGFSAVVKYCESIDDADFKNSFDAKKELIIDDASNFFNTQYTNCFNELSQEMALDHKIFSPIHSANLVFWNTDDTLLCLAENLCGKDLEYIGKKNILGILQTVEYVSNGFYRMTHKDQNLDNPEYPGFEEFSAELTSAHAFDTPVTGDHDDGYCPAEL